VSDSLAYRLEGVTREYGGRAVLRVERLGVPVGRTLCLVGPTGSGKSTLLRLLAGLEPPTSGGLWLGGHRLDGREVPPSVLRRVTLVFQRPQPLAGTVLDNASYGLRLRGLRDAGAKASEALGLLGLAGLAGRPARTLSGGEIQLLALARALALRTEVLLLDEPTAHLDPARVALAEEAVRRAGGAGTTVVLATHNLFQARRLADRVALLLDGQVVEAAPAGEFFESPADPRTAAFVRGEMI
jgi:tungstate transport system ATP-binding protein